MRRRVPTKIGVRIGGLKDFPHLKELSCDGALTIERKISGEEQTGDVIRAGKLPEQYI